MGSELFINYSIPLLNLTFKVLGKKGASLLVNKTAGSVFTSGENEFSLIKDMKNFEKRGIGCIGNYVVEGMHKYDARLVN